jgi:hypothetical protein
MNTQMLEIAVGQLQELPASDNFAADELAGVDLQRCSITCWFSCWYTCDVTE